MAVPKKTKNYLDKRMAKYDEVAHRTVYTAYDAAQTLRRELKDIAKSLIIAADKAYVIAVVPANMKLDLVKLRKALSVKKVSIPSEKLVTRVFKVKPGSVTAFGGLHKVETVVDKSLLKAKDVILSAGSLTDSIRMKTKDFIELEEAKLASFTKAGGYKLQKAKKKKKAAPKKKSTAKKKPAKKVVKKKVTKKSPSKKKVTSRKSTSKARPTRKSAKKKTR